MSSVVAKLSDVSKSYGQGNSKLAVLNSCSISFEAGKSYAIVGSSGIGKSTLLHILAGLDKADSGEITLCDKKLTTLTSDQLAEVRRKHLGIVFQFHHLLPEFTAIENICMPLKIAGEIPSDRMNELANKLLATLGISQRSSHLPGELSGGEQQRVAIARALIASPSIVLADEPTGNLDPHTADEVAKLLFAHTKTNNTTLIIVTHSDKLAEMADYKYKMLPGGLLQLIS